MVQFQPDPLERVEKLIDFRGIKFGGTSKAYMDRIPSSQAFETSANEFTDTDQLTRLRETEI